MKKDLENAGELFPQSVFIVATYDEQGVPNAMNVAWGGECTRHEIAINIGGHKTTENILAKGTFTVAPADRAHAAPGLRLYSPHLSRGGRRGWRCLGSRQGAAVRLSLIHI